MGHPVDCVHCAPTLIENMWEYISDNGGDFTPLASLKLLQPGGAALSETIVQSLATNGVNVKTTYGTTETGPPLRSIPHTRENPTCYKFRNLYPDNPFLKMEEVGEGLYEFVVYKGFELAAELWEGKPDDEPYRTNDLFIQDPPGSGFFVLQGRKDDILVHSNGENTSAGPLQLDVQTSSKIIKRVLALGHSRPCVSLLVELHELHDPENKSVRDQVWETVKKVNERYPGHSQVMQSMIYILQRGSTLPVTPKGNVKRKEAEKIFASAIESLYSTFSFESSGFSSTQPLHVFVRNLLSTLSGQPVAEIRDWTTLYDLGIDSRLALSLRASLSTYLGKPISLSTIFEHPSISSLTSFLVPNRANSGPTISEEPQPSTTETVNRAINSFSKEFKSWTSRTPSITTGHQSPEQETILLTGASGTLGTALLSTLISFPSVHRIYALIRTPSPFQKLHSSLLDRSLDPHILTSISSKIVVLGNYSMQDPLLGLDIDTYQLLSHTVTLVIHNAWKMDFNLPLAAFDDCLRSCMSLLRFCHAGRASKVFAFTSSVATCLGSGSGNFETGGVVREDAVGDDASVSAGTGYALSKYVVERLTQTASRELGMHVRILRIGQLCGDTATGIWSEREMWPMLIRTSADSRMGPALPRLQRMVDWMPVDIAATAIAEILLSHHTDATLEEVYEVHNIVNPHPIPWSSLITMLQSSRPALSSAGAQIAVIPLADWVARLAALADVGVSPTEIPALKLLGAFEMMVDEEVAGERESEEEGSGSGIGNGGKKVFETTKSQGLSNALRECGSFCQEWLDGNVRVWRESGFLA